MGLKEYDGQMIRLTDTGGKSFTGTASFSSAEYCLHEYGRKEDGLEINGYLVYAGEIREIVPLPRLEVLRAAETWQQAGAYYVRIQAMAKKHHIPLRQEFDGHDGPDTKYIVVTDDGFPVATARIYPLDERRMMIGRVVVLPEYRRKGIGTLVVTECETWAEELGFTRTVLESRDNKTAFYEELGYEICGTPEEGDTFRCVRMEKEL